MLNLLGGLVLLEEMPEEALGNPPRVLLPADAIIGSHVVVCVPDYKCFWDYIDWATLQGAEQVGLMVQSRSEFNEQHSKATCMRTVLTLATKGHPELVMSMVMGGREAITIPRDRRKGSLGATRRAMLSEI